MPIVIKEIFSSDPISEALEKINFNFDQLILSGGGPPGPIGPIGLPGIAGTQGLRGDHWQVGGASGIGFTGPTTDHGPNYGDLQDSDAWIDSNGKVWVWQGGSTDSWVDSGVNLTGPTGKIGPTGASTDLVMYLGNSGGSVDAASYLPNATLGSTTITQGNSDFYVLNKIDVNSFLIGSPTWAYSKLLNFSNLDIVNGFSTASPSQRMMPKQAIIQSGIDYTGFGGLAIGAYGLKNNDTTVINDYKGGSSQTAVVNGNSFFNAGWKIRLNTDSTYSHVFNLKTGFNDLEIQSGDVNSLLGNTTSKISLISKTIELKGVNDGISDQIRFTTGPTYSRFRDLLAIGFDTTTNTTILPGIIAADWNANRLIVNGATRLHGDLFVGDRSNPSQRIFNGINRLVDGNSEINMYAGVANTGLFQIKRESGINGNSHLYNTGSGHFSIVNTGGGNINLYGSNSAWIGLRNIGANTSGIDIQTSPTINSYVRFVGGTNEVARITTDQGRLGIGTAAPTATLHINAPLGSNEVSIAAFTNKTNSSYTTIGAAGVSSSVPTWNPGSNILEFVPDASLLGSGIIGTYTGDLKFQTGYRQNKMIILQSGDVGIGTVTPSAKLEITELVNNIGPSIGSYSPLMKISSNNGNLESVEFGSLRTSNGLTWETAGFRIQEKIDQTWMGFIQFNGTDNKGGIQFGTGLTTTSRQTIATRMTINQFGNVGIGSTSPSDILHIKSSSSANIKIESDPNNQSIIDFYPHGYNSTALQDPTGLSIIGPSNENLQGRFGLIGYRDGALLITEARDLFITNDRYKISKSKIGTRWYGMQSETENIKIESSGIINFKVNEYELAIPNPSPTNAMPIVRPVDMLTIVPGTGNYQSFFQVLNRNARIGINNTNPVNGYILHINGQTLLDGNLIFGGNLAGGGTSGNYSIRTLGPTSLSIGTNNKANIFISGTNGFVGIGNPSTAVIQEQIQAPRSPLQVTIPFTQMADIDTGSPHQMKHNLGRYLGSMSDFQKGLIMLHPAADGNVGPGQPYSMCCGKFYVVRGGRYSMLIIDTIEVDSASGYDSNRGMVKANISFDADNGNYANRQDLRRDNVFLTVVDTLFNGLWVALYIGYPLQAHSVYFDGINNNSGWNGFGGYPTSDMYYWKTVEYDSSGTKIWPVTSPGGPASPEERANLTVFTNKYINYSPIANNPGAGPNGWNINKYHQGVDAFAGLKFQNEPGDVTSGYIKNKFGFQISFYTTVNSLSVNYNSGFVTDIGTYGNNNNKQIGFAINRILLPNEYIVFSITISNAYFGTQKQLWMIDYPGRFNDYSSNRTYFTIYGLDLPSGVSNYGLHVEGTVWTTYY